MEVAKLMLDYAFEHQNFHRVAIGVVGFNTKALNFYKPIGFQREGVQRDGYYYEHRYHDFVMMSLLGMNFERCGREMKCQDDETFYLNSIAPDISDLPERLDTCYSRVPATLEACGWLVAADAIIKP
jgi:hypothetical protein